MTTSTTNDFDKISPTALLTAYARQFSDIPYTKEIAALTNAIATVKQFIVQDQDQEQPIVAGALIEARYKAMEQVIDRLGRTQILELASGLLPRGLVRSQDPSVTVVESDLPGMIQQKQQLVRQLVGDRPNLHLLAIDATAQPNPLLQISHFDATKPVTIVCEGLLMYLSLTEKERVFANVREMLQAYGGVWITPDLITKVREAQMHQSNAALARTNQRIANETGRPFVDRAFDTDEHVREFAAAQGFQIEAFSMLAVMDQLTCVVPLGIDPEQVKPLLATTPVFALTLT